MAVSSLQTARLTVLQAQAIGWEGPGSAYADVIRAAALVPSSEQTARIPRWTKADWDANVARVVNPGGTYPEQALASDYQEVFLPKIGVDVPIPFEKVRGQDQQYIDRGGSRRAQSAILLKLLADLNTLWFTTSWTTAVTASASFATQTTDCIKILREELFTAIANKSNGHWPNLMVCGRTAWERLVNNDTVQARLPTTGTQKATAATVADVLDLPPGGVIVIPLTIDGAEALSGDNIWAGIVNMDPDPVALEPSAYYTPRLSIAGGSPNQPYEFERFEVKKSTGGDDRWIYRARSYFKVTQTAADAGGRIDTVP